MLEIVRATASNELKFQTRAFFLSCHFSCFLPPKHRTCSWMKILHPLHELCIMKRKASDAVEPSLGLFLIAKDLWSIGKQAPVVNTCLNVLEVTFGHIVHAAAGKDLAAVEHEIVPCLKSIDNVILAPVIYLCCELFGNIVSEAVAAVESFFAKPSCSGDDFIVSKALALSEPCVFCPTKIGVSNIEIAKTTTPTAASLILTNIEAIEIDPTEVSLRDLKECDPLKKVQSKRLKSKPSLFASNRLTRRKSKKAQQQEVVDLETPVADCSPVRSDLGETPLIKEAIRYFERCTDSDGFSEADMTA